MGVIFFAGSYGVGKSTLGNKLNKITKFPFYSAGDLISEFNGEVYGANKFVKNLDNNQSLLLHAINKALDKNDTLLLAGHFCVFEEDLSVKIIPKNTFDELQLSAIILLESSAERIIKNISDRDSKTYYIEAIEELIQKENDCAIETSKRLNLPLFIHEMNYENDEKVIGEIIKKLT